MTPFQAVCTALAATVGTGNIAGVAGAIAIGGPMYYIKNGLSSKWKWLAALYSLFGVLTVFGTGNATQVNTITTAIDSALLNYNLLDTSKLDKFNLIAGILIAALVAMCCFAFSTIIGWGLYGARCIEFLFNEKVIPNLIAVFLLSGKVVEMVKEYFETK